MEKTREDEHAVRPLAHRPAAAEEPAAPAIETEESDGPEAAADESDEREPVEEEMV